MSLIFQPFVVDDALNDDVLNGDALHLLDLLLIVEVSMVQMKVLLVLMNYVL